MKYRTDESEDRAFENACGIRGKCEYRKGCTDRRYFNCKRISLISYFISGEILNGLESVFLTRFLFQKEKTAVIGNLD